MIKKILKNLKYIKIKDLISPFIFIISLPIAVFLKITYKLKKEPLWLICERENAASDNGYYLFMYIREKYPEKRVYYAIDKKCSDYDLVKTYGNIIQYGSFKHWIYYLAASKNISTQKSGNPNPPFFYFLQVSGLWRNKRIFLQHGITMNNVDYIHYNNAKFCLITCGAKPEYEYMKEHFGYPEKAIQYTGFARFDRLHHTKINKKEIVLMPTWRSWISRETNFLDQNEKQDFCNTAYYKAFQNILEDEELTRYLEEKGITLYFYPHIRMQKFNSYFKIKSNNVKIVTNKEKTIQELLETSALLITDYSSVSLDFAYKKQPVIYYQFDYEEFRKKHLQEGYFSYEENGFGPVLKEHNRLIEEIKKSCETEFLVEEKYQKRHKDFFTICDDKNCERIFKSICEC